MILVDRPLWKAHGRRFAHLVSDTSREELHAFAAELGLPERAFHRDHYDLPDFLWDEAVAAGAVPTDPRELVRRLKAAGLRDRRADRPGAEPFAPAAISRTLAQLGGDSSAALAVARDLAARHAEPHRRYHTDEHVGEVLAELHRLLRDRSAADVPARDRAILRCAAWFHDAVYEVGGDGAPGSSEAASADLAVRTLGAAGVPDRAVLAEVERLVLLTVGHTVDADDALGALLVDSDLWILSAPAERYGRYAADVRAEYAHVPDDLWTAGRGAVLDRFLASADALYGAGDAEDRVRRRQSAVDNLTRERAALP